MENDGFGKLFDALGHLDGYHYFRPCADWDAIHCVVSVRADLLLSAAGLLQIIPDIDIWLERCPKKNGDKVDWERVGARIILCSYLRGTYNKEEK